MALPVFLSVVCVVRNSGPRLEPLLRDTSERVRDLVSDYELIIVENASEDASVGVLKQLTTAEGLPNLQVYALTKEVSSDTAAWVGVENALGDYVVVIDLLTDSLSILPDMLEKALAGVDVVFASNRQRPRQRLVYRLAYAGFNALYKAFSGIDLDNEAPSYRLLSRRVVHFILQHPHPALSYRHLPATAGFERANLQYSAPPLDVTRKRLGESVDRAVRLLVSTTHGPMRLVTTLSLFGAVANLAYSAYVVVVAIFKADIAPGWISLSLLQSGMFFLLSLVLLVLGEYVLHMMSLTNEGPKYHVAQEFTSARMTRREKLNLEVVAPSAGARSDRIHSAEP